MPKVYNKRDPNCPSDAIYIGRPSEWGNPYLIGPDGTRKEVIEQFRANIIGVSARVKKIQEKLKGKDLVCWCAPKACHGDVLLEIANSEEIGNGQSKRRQ